MGAAPHGRAHFLLYKALRLVVLSQRRLPLGRCVDLVVLSQRRLPLGRCVYTHTALAACLSYGRRASRARQSSFLRGSAPRSTQPAPFPSRPLCLHMHCTGQRVIHICTAPFGRAYLLFYEALRVALLSQRRLPWALCLHTRCTCSVSYLRAPRLTDAPISFSTRLSASQYSASAVFH